MRIFDLRKTIGCLPGTLMKFKVNIVANDRSFNQNKATFQDIFQSHINTLNNKEQTHESSNYQ